MTSRAHWSTVALISVLQIAWSSCERGGRTEKETERGRALSGQSVEIPPEPQPEIARGVAVLAPTQGQGVRGSVTFTSAETGLTVLAQVEGLAPGPHGFHVHEFGDCSAPDAATAGEHWNPTAKPHGSPRDREHHVGDLGNLVADEKGQASLKEGFPLLTFSGKHGILGRSEPAVLELVLDKARGSVSRPYSLRGGAIGCSSIARGRSPSCLPEMENSRERKGGSRD